jgi:hypothetical protein
MNSSEMLEKKTINVTLIIITLIIVMGCTQGPPAYEKAYLGMPLQELLSSYYEAKKVRGVPDEKGGEVVEYSLPPEGNVKRSGYFFRNDQLIGMVIVYSRESDFDYLANKLALKNGKPTQVKTVDNTKGAHWRRTDSYIMLLHGIKGTQIKLPIGETGEIKPEEVILIIGKRPEA